MMTKVKKEQTMIDTKKFIKEPFETYLEKSKEYLSSHALIDFRKCPLVYHMKKTGEITRKDKEYYYKGHAIHTLVLEGQDVLDETYQVGGPVNPKTDKEYGPMTNKFKEFAAECEKPILRAEDLDLIKLMNESVRNHPKANELLSGGQAEVIFRTKIQNEPCQIRVDYWKEDPEIIADLKTCKNLDEFETDMWLYNYIEQLTFYAMTRSGSAEDNWPEAWLVAVEKQFPYRVGVWQINQSLIEKTAVQLAFSIMDLQECRDKGKWPTGFEAPRTVGRRK